MKVKSESEVAQLCPTLSDPMDCSLTGSSIHGIFQARVLEWGAIAFSDIFDKVPISKIHITDTFKELCTRMIIKALFIIKKNRKQLTNSITE